MMRTPSQPAEVRAAMAREQEKGVKIVKYVRFLGALGCLCACGVQAQPGLPAPLQQALSKYRVPDKSVSVFVQRVDQQAPLLAWRAQAPRNPASTIKLLTTFVALDRLGPTYTWKTEFYSAQAPQRGVVKGDLYLKGHGDPYLVIENFWRLLRGLRHAGVHTIEGDLVIDDSYFAPVPADPAEFDGKPERAYNVSPSAALLNFLSVQFYFRPDEQGNVSIVADPDPGLKIENHMRVSSGYCGNWQHRVSMDVKNDDDGNKVVFSGRYPRECGERSYYRVVTDADRYLAGVFRSLWQEQGGVFKGSVRKAGVPRDAVLLYQGESRPLSAVVRAINKYSNNVMTRQLLLTLGAEYAGAPGTEQKGVAAVRDWLQGKQLDFPELVLENGAGLSREVRISAEHLGQLLLHAWRSPLMPEYMSSLPVAALDGTLRKRFAGTAMEGRVHLKTGLLDGVRGLAGYVLDAQNRRWVVVCLHNHARAPTAAGGVFQEALVEWVHSQP